MNIRDNSIDCIKGIAIIAIVLYHLKFIPNGYLGVDVFLVVNGYLIMLSVIRHKEGISDFSFIGFMKKRIVRLFPVLLAGCIFVMLLGYFVMLPDDYESLAETAVASVCGANNILQAITTHNYWDAVQEYKPLMHTWYLGVILQFYFVYGIFTYIVSRFFRSNERVYVCGLTVLTILSWILYVIPGDSANKFYYLQYRFWELAVGAVLAIALKEEKIQIDSDRAGKYIYGSMIVMVIILSLPYGRLPKMPCLILIVLCSLIVLSAINFYKKKEISNKIAGGGYTVFRKIGVYSYSIYIWHQIIIAFYRYCIDGNIGIAGSLFCIILTLFLGIISYLTIEKWLSVRLKSLTIGVLCIDISSIVFGAGLYVYVKGGVMRDVPELDVVTSDIHRGMHSEYNERVYAMDVEFASDDRIKVLAVGNSFVRDWCNVLLESDIADELDISYVSSPDKNESYANRIPKADYIFVNASMVCENSIPECIVENMGNRAELWSIGTKCYGVSNGNVYNRRYREDYFQMTASYEDVKEQYQKELELCGEQYVDFIKPVLQEKDQVRVFTDTGKFISQDCRHLTKAGAQYYARILDFDYIFYK